MAPRAVPCDSCGSPIPDSDLETGAAVTLLGKRYCAGCKTEAIQAVSLEDLSGAPAAPVRKPAAPAKPAASKAAPPPPAPSPARLERKAPARRPVPAPAAPNRTPLIAAAAALVLLLAGGGAFVALRSSPEDAPPPPVPAKGPAKTAPAPASGDADSDAKTAFAKVQELADRGGTSWTVILAAGEKARGACRGTSFEQPLESLLARARREKESEDAARELAPLIDELKGAVAGDPEFKRYSELQPKFLLAIETGAKSGSTRVAEIRALQNDYNSRYEKLAEPHSAEIYEAATVLTDERRYDDAIRKIDTFPQQFRNSNAWKALLKLRQDIERKKK